MLSNAQQIKLCLICQVKLDIGVHCASRNALHWINLWLIRIQTQISPDLFSEAKRYSTSLNNHPEVDRVRCVLRKYVVLFNNGSFSVRAIYAYRDVPNPLWKLFFKFYKLIRLYVAECIYLPSILSKSNRKRRVVSTKWLANIL